MGTTGMPPPFIAGCVAARACLVIAALALTSAAAEPRHDAYGDPLPEHAIARLGTVRFRHSYPVSEICFFSDGQRLLTCDMGGGVRVWQLPTGELLKKWYFPGCLRFALTSDGKTLAAAADDGVLLLIDTATGDIRDRLHGHATQAHALAISIDSKWLASATWDWSAIPGDDSPREKQLRLWNLQTGELARTLELPDRFTIVLAFDASGDRIFTAGGRDLFAPGDIRVWDTVGDAEPRNFGSVPTASTWLQVMRRGDRIFAQRDAETIVACDVNTGQEQASLKIGRVSSFAVSHDGTKIATEIRNQDDKFVETGVAIWDFGTGRQIRDFKLPHLASALVKWSLDDRFLAFADERTVRVIDAESGTKLFAEDEARYGINHLAIAPGDKRLIAASESRHSGRGIRIWQQTGLTTFVESYVGEPGERITGLSFPEPLLLASASTNGALKLWDVTERKLKRTVFQGEKEISALALNSYSKLAAFVHADEIHIVDLDTCADRVLLQGESRYSITGRIAFTQDLLSILYRHDRQVKQRSTLDKFTQNLLRSPREFMDFALSSDDKWLVTNRPLSTSEPRDSELIVSERETGDVLSVITTPREWSRCPVFSPDGKLLAAGVSVRGGSNIGKSVGGAIYLWRISGKQLVRVPLDSAVSSLAFTDDGKWIVSGLEDTSILVWDLAGILADVKD